LQVSLLTVMPRPNEVYTVYGHSALRLYYPEKGINDVYNWGIFSFNHSFFLYRFIKGETDYSLGVSDYNEFLYYYALGNSTIEEQVLNLSSGEKEKLLEILSNNLLPQNIVYRYNFLFDNCTTRIRDIIEKITDNRVIYPASEKEVTFRDLIRSCTSPYPWMSFGIDLIIGNGADSLINVRQQMFLPVNLKEFWDESYVIEKTDSTTVKRPIVELSQTILKTESQQNEKTASFFDAFRVGILIFVFYLIVTVWSIRKKRMFKGVFSILFLIAGLCGIVVGFLLFFSEHPCVSPNWNILWLHPLHFIGFAGYFFKKSYPLITLFHGLNLVLLCILLFGWLWIPQTLNTANIPYALCLFLASVSWFYYMKKNKRFRFGK
jgi:hypothetical protein